MPDSNPSLHEALGRSIGTAPRHSAPRARPRLAPAIGWSLGLLILATAGRAAIFTVGTVGGCTHANLSSALASAAANGPGHDEIRLSADQVGHFEIWNQSVSLIGGYANCAASTPTGSTLLGGTGSSGVLYINAGTGSYRLADLAHLEITGGYNFYGGGIHVLGSAYVVLEDTAVYGNTATSAGGGIMVEGNYNAILVLDQGSSVMSNSASNGASLGVGGGIYCTETAPASTVVSLLDAFIYDNEAVQDGGGLYLRGCDLTSYSGGGLRGIVGNRAKRGGGVFAWGGALVRFYGSSQNPALISGNTATAPLDYPGWPYGSAVRIEGAGTRLELHDSWVLDNHGDVVIGAKDADSVVIDRTLGANCHDPVRCSRISGNSYGISIHNTSLTLRDTFLEENGLTVVHLQANSRPVQIEGCVFARNTTTAPGRPRIISVGSGQVRIAYSTFVDNLTDATCCTQYVIGLDPQPGSRDLTFVGNLVAETGGELVDTYYDMAMWDVYNEIFDCLIVHEGSMLPPVSTGTTIRPGSSAYFVDRAGHDYHLAAGTLPIDYCDTLYYSPGLDIDLQPRGYDDPAVVDWYGPLDLGADERSPASLLFADGFESGNTSHWSAAVP